tara:strand:- start:33703 stop:34572 length:870 start_codon:yes stop_codon:yes gene_type:complete
MEKFLLIILSSFFCFVMVSCSTTGADQTSRWTPDKLYTEAKLELNSGNYDTALSLYKKLSTRYPFGVYAQQAQLEVAYAHWKNGQSGLALAALDRYLKLYPNQLGIEYALYLKGLINFNDNMTLFSSFTGEDMAERDAEAARLAFESFKKLVIEFPNSNYSIDAYKRLEFLLTVLAENEVHVARFYLRKSAYHAALNRAKTLIINFQGAPAVEEALAIMIECYNELKLVELSGDTAQILKMNFPNSPYLLHSYDPFKRGGLSKNIRNPTNTTWKEFNLIERLKNIIPDF